MKDDHNLSSVPNGYSKRILRVDLSRKLCSNEQLSREMSEKYIGGYGIGGKILYDEVPPWVGSLDPANRLIFATGPITASNAPIAGRHSVITKSPLTGYFGDANSGGFWGAELKMAGYDAIVLTGRSSKPALLYVNDNHCEIYSANAYWGLDAREADRAIKKDLNEKNAKVATIGIAGENLVRFAGIVNDEANRIAARSGVGAVMGFMKLKAIMIRGHGSISSADSETIRKLSRDTSKHVKNDPSLSLFTRGGTPSGFEMVSELGIVPEYNWSKGDLEVGDPNIQKISFPGGYERILSGNHACHICPIACRRKATVRDSPYAFEENVEGPEYETLAAFGPNCGLYNIEVIAKLNDLCNIYGIDTISAGSTIAFAMECFEKGLISRKDTYGIDLRFGNGDAMIDILNKIAKREGFGNILAEGTRRAAKIIGQGSEAYAMQVKGMELSMCDPRAFQGMGLHFACTPTGGRHTEGITAMAEMKGDRYSPKGKADLVKKIEDWTAFYNAAGFCYFGLENNAYSIDEAIELFNAVTGLSLDVNQALKAGERIVNLKRMFNMRHGATRNDDMLPQRFLKETTKSGVVNKLSEMLPDYYRARGWDKKTAKPTAKKLAELELDK